MKNVKFLFMALVASLLFACNADVSLNTINVKVLNKKDEVSNGEDLKIDIKVRDSEGIDYIQIVIPVLSVDERIENHSDDNKWEFEKHFLVDNPDFTGKAEVFVTVMDKDGEEYVDTEDFTIK